MAMALSEIKISFNTFSTSLRICFAFCEQTFIQWPQTIHLSDKTVACPFITLIAFAGHSRTQE